MRTGIQPLFFASLIALSGGLSAAETDPAMTHPAMPGDGKNQATSADAQSGNDEATNQGKRLFNSYCFLCHGGSGRGDGVLAEKLNIVGTVADLTRPKYGQMTVEQIEEIIAGYNRPQSQMPKWGSVLAKEDLRSIAGYVKTLQPRFALINGKRVYASACVACHGADGKGKGPLAESLKLSARVPDLTSEKYRSMSEDQLVKAAVAYSAKEDALPKWDTVLAPDQIYDVMSYIKNFGVSELHIYGDAERGRDVFRLNCVACHGQQGKGDGILAELLGVKMVDYTSKSQLDISDEALIHTISMGKGEFMPRWFGQLSSDQIRNAAAYVRTLYKSAGGNEGTAPASAAPPQR